MPHKRKPLPIDVKRLVLHEGGYKCGNPACRNILTLDIHHLVPVAKEGPDFPDNLLALCPNCHALHHKGEIPAESIRAWKMLLLALNEAYDKRSIDILLTLRKVGWLGVSGDGVLHSAALVAASLVEATWKGGFRPGEPVWYEIRLTSRGEMLVDAWLVGDQQAAIELTTLI